MSDKGSIFSHQDECTTREDTIHHLAKKTETRTKGLSNPIVCYPCKDPESFVRGVQL